VNHISIIKAAAGAFACAIVVAGCIVQPAGRPPQPAPVVEVAPAAPAPGYHWVKGRYVWAENRWVWVRGYWVQD
jgi:hypothetical protein